LSEQTVAAYVDAMARLVPTVKTAADWAPLAEFVDVDGFERVGTFLEVQEWQQYTEMLTLWVSTIDRFETVVRRIGELANRVYYEVEERHHRAGAVHVVNSMTVFEFDDADKIRHLDVYLQQAR
jgi:hypothetical protein